MIPDHIEDYMKDHQFTCMVKLLELSGIRHTVRKNHATQTEVNIECQQGGDGIGLFYNHTPIGDIFVCQE